ncbi:ribosome biogenesis protein, putative [Ichthyophthirius multifiliis]|uniref:Ribosome biogenesis protein, putative n=1 Tax=Ichthyophthirius multifiliis TaxID=5932 RepID=G0QK12_ICHMU|nr:ribosome biogenesis protein, putative [Ichthyophthirius multifiliis]EGR34439.1 ribosome biogenesis protein, putative [Ichthyophthirius multifiliis]|eukprot:XP_004039743.1 ribosome biogenesis protein, putative [Ichthyophthirius multifiliis]
MVNQAKPPRVVYFLPLNDSADTQQLLEQIKQYISNILQKYEDVQMGENIQQINQTRMSFKFPYYQFFAHPTYFPGLIKENFIFIAGEYKNFENMLDYCKVADIICPVLSCKDTNLEKLNLDPYNNANAFSDWGYKILSALKIQGLPSTVQVLQNIASIPQNKQKEVKKLFQRYFMSEFQPESFISIENEQTIFQLLRTLQGTQLQNFEWKENRGYMLCDEVLVNTQNQVVEFTGFLRGSCINANQLLHVTGYDDFQIEKIEILKNPYKIKQKIKKNIFKLILVQNAGEEENIQEEELKENTKYKQQNGTMDQIDLENINDEDIISVNSQDDAQQEVESGKKQKILELLERNEDELEFEDEVEYNTQLQIRDRYEKYQGMKSFKNSEWDEFENLPDPYEKIYTFKNYIRTKKNAYINAEENAFAYGGFYIKIYVKGFPINKLIEHPKEKPLILSTVLKHERKMTVVHLKIRRNNEYEGQNQILSKKNYLINFGFRKATVNTIFSKMYAHNSKTKYVKKLKEKNANYMASFYYQNIYPPANVLIFAENEIQKAEFCLNGELLKSDPLQIILKRIIFTGYPYKINKRKCVVRLMFFNPLDIKYFQPVELKTKLGLRGKIQESLGTHGLMKCQFSNFVKPNDTICMHLFKRVFPKSFF